VARTDGAAQRRSAKRTARPENARHEATAWPERRSANERRHPERQARTHSVAQNRTAQTDSAAKNDVARNRHRRPERQGVDGRRRLKRHAWTAVLPRRFVEAALGIPRVRDSRSLTAPPGVRNGEAQKRRDHRSPGSRRRRAGEMRSGTLRTGMRRNCGRGTAGTATANGAGRGSATGAEPEPVYGRKWAGADTAGRNWSGRVPLKAPDPKGAGPKKAPGQTRTASEPQPPSGREQGPTATRPPAGPNHDHDHDGPNRHPNIKTLQGSGMSTAISVLRANPSHRSSSSPLQKRPGSYQPGLRPRGSSPISS
jgi:hypothetical protein